MMKRIKTYAEVWPYYLREHAKPATRAWHYVGTAIAIGILIAVIVTGRWAFLPLVLVAGYFFAWLSHGLIEKNKPATFIICSGRFIRVSRCWSVSGRDRWAQSFVRRASSLLTWPNRRSGRL